MQKQRKIIMYSVAGVVALGAAMVARNALMTPPAPEETEPVVAQPVGEVKVLVVSRDISPGEKIEPSSLQWVAWPKHSVLPGMITEGDNPDAIERLSQAWARGPLVSGEPILDSKVIFPEDGSYLSSVLAPGMRAVAIPVGFTETAGGYIKPYDRVDILFVKNGEDIDAAEEVLRNVKVLAIDDAVVGNKEGKGGSDEDGVGRLQDVSQATLEITLPQARVLAKLAREGHLVMALRSLADRAPSGAPELVGRFKAMANGEGAIPESSGIRIIARGVLKEGDK